MGASKAVCSFHESMQSIRCLRFVGFRSPWLKPAGVGVAAIASALILGACALSPNRLSDAERKAEALYDVAAAFDEQEPLNGRLTLEQAFARALAYNLDQRVKLLEEAVAQNDLDLSKYDLLPKLVANAGYVTRSNQEASSSQSILSGRQSLEPSTSSDRNRWVADLGVSWNILDFGVSYFSARQQGDRRLIAEEQRRRVVHNIFQDVRRAYWRAASAQILAREVDDTIRAANAALTSSQAVESEALRSPIEALRYQRVLLEFLRQLELLQRQLEISKIELAALINLPTRQHFTLAVPRTMRAEILRVPLVRMEEVALLRNPDIREQSYQVRISADEARKAMVRLLPGIGVNYGRFYDSNSFLVNPNWYGGAVRLTESLINIAMIPQQMQRGENLNKLAEFRRQAVSVAVLAKTHIAYRQYLAAAKDFEWSDRLAQVDRRLYQQVSNRVASDAQGDLERVTARVGAVTAEVRRFYSFADAQAALGRLYATIGLDPLPSSMNTLDLGTLEKQIRHAMTEQQAAALDAFPDSKHVGNDKQPSESSGPVGPSEALARASVD